MECLIFAEAQQLQQLSGSKLSSLLPFLTVIAAENKLKLSIYSQFKKAYSILQKSIFNN